VKATLTVLGLMLLAACSDATGSHPDLTGQWLVRMYAGTTGPYVIGCRVNGTVRLTGNGNTYSGRMLLPERSCGSLHDISESFDSTTTLEAQVVGDSVVLTLRAGPYTFSETASLLGDSLTGHIPGDPFGLIGARRYPASVPLDRAAVRFSGAVTRTVELQGYGFFSGIHLASPSRDESLLLAPIVAQPPLTVGTYPVGRPGDPLGGYHDRLVAGLVDQIRFTGGTLTVTGADAQIATGSMDLTGIFEPTGGKVRVQADFTVHQSVCGCVPNVPAPIRGAQAREGVRAVSRPTAGVPPR
jgi:hypothetical protein